MAGLALDPIPLRLVEEDLAGAAQRLGASFAATGFALVCGHGVPEPAIADTLAAMRAFFALPEACKRRAHRPGTGGARGFTPFGIETARGAQAHDLKEFLHIGRELPAGHRYSEVMPPNVWPETPAGLRPAALALYAALEASGLRLLRAIAVHLGQPPGFFEDAVAEGNSVLRLLHYPPLRPHEAGLRAGAHEDINVITLLLGAEEAGLEILCRDGVWRAIAAPPGTMLVNVGDMLARLSGGALPSTTHRVALPAPERRGVARYSMPFFLHFRPDYVIAPLNGAATPPPIRAHAFLEERLREIRLL